MESALEGAPRIHRIRRSHHLGYGFIAGSELPTMVKIIEPNGPSFKRLLPGDVIMAVNGIDVEQMPREQIIKMIQLNEEEIEIKVRQPTYEEIIRAKNLADPKFYMFNKSNTLSHNNDSRSSMSNPQHRPLPTPLRSSSSKESTMNRLVTSISEQQQRPLISSCEDQTAANDTRTILKQRTNDNEIGSGFPRDNLIINGTSTLGRFKKNSNYGRHSPQLERCKSSMDTNQTGKGKKSGDSHHDQPMLKRSNTMRPIRSKVSEIFEVVIRIFFEDGHTKVLTYNQHTTVSIILETLNTRLIGGSDHFDQLRRYFGLVLTVNSESAKEQQLSKRKLLHVLDENDSIMKIRQLPYASHLRLLYRMIYPPQDVSKLYLQSKVAFDYLYRQSCNDLRLERFSPSLDAEATLKLSALHIMEYIYSNHPRDHGNSKEAKLYIKLVKKTPGINHFVPRSMIETAADKKGKKANYKRLKTKLLDQLKKNLDEFDPPKAKSTTNLNTSTSFHELSLPELRSSPSDYAKLLFLDHLSQLPCYGNARRPIRTTGSPVEHSSIGDCSSSLESVPRTSDSSPLLKHDRDHSHLNHNVPPDLQPTNTISRLAQMNSIRSLSTSIQPPSSNGRAQDQIDMVQTPSIESISSITFNMQNSPSPQQVSSHISQHSESYMFPRSLRNPVEPSPMPRQSSLMSKAPDYHSIDKLYSQRYLGSQRSIDELLRKAILLPPPPTPTSLLDGLMRQKPSYGSITPILTDGDLERLRVPPPPRVAYRP